MCGWIISISVSVYLGLLGLDISTKLGLLLLYPRIVVFFFGILLFQKVAIGVSLDVCPLRPIFFLLDHYHLFNLCCLDAYHFYSFRFKRTRRICCLRLDINNGSHLFNYCLNPISMDSSTGRISDLMPAILF